MLEHYPCTYGVEVGVGSLGTPSKLFQLLVLSMLMGARIRASVALEAAQALFDHKWTRADRMAAVSWEERASVLNDAGYARFDERTSTMLGEAARMLQDKYGGDLRRLRDKASREPSAERRLLKELKGVGDVSVDIFFREAQAAWDEIYPFADQKALDAARRLGLGAEVGSLWCLAGTSPSWSPRWSALTSTMHIRTSKEKPLRYL